MSFDPVMYSPSSSIDSTRDGGFFSEGSGSHTSGSPPSSVCSFGEDEHFEELHRQTQGLVQRLLKEKKESDRVISAWRVRCETLEAEVKRLAAMVAEQEPKEVKTKWSKGPEKAPRRTPSKAPASLSSAFSSPNDSATLSSSSRSKPICLDWRAAGKEEVIHVVNPSLPMSKQHPPACNNFYLLRRCAVPSCKFSHSYKLTTPQVEEMRRGAKFHICNAVRNGAICTDQNCCYGHECPKGTACGRQHCEFPESLHYGPGVAKR